MLFGVVSVLPGITGSTAGTVAAAGTLGNHKMQCSESGASPPNFNRSLNQRYIRTSLGPRWREPSSQCIPAMSFPQTLEEWRKQGEAWGENRKYEPYDLWRPFIPFFQSHGLTLWETSARYPLPTYNLLQPKGIERAPDGFSYLSEYFPDGLPELEYHIQQVVRHYFP